LNAEHGLSTWVGDEGSMKHQTNISS